jgi:diguanylate cyclase (GGDEF)-like protein
MLALIAYGLFVLIALLCLTYAVRKLYFAQKHNLSLINQRASAVAQAFSATVADITAKEDEIRRIFSVYEINRRLASEVEEDRLYAMLVSELRSVSGVTDVAVEKTESARAGFFSFVFGHGPEKRYVYVAAPEAFVFAQLPHIMAQFSVFLDRAHMYKRLQRMSITDGLTGIANRRHFIERFRLEFLRSMRNGYPISVLMIDIDHFKKVNDTYGHLVGDEILSATARTLAQQLREIDFLARFGGEEFVIFLPETGCDGAAKVAERIRGAVERSEYKAYDEKLHVTVSVGTATYPQDGDDKDVLIERADAALYRAKQQGRNRVVAYTEDVR